jgi:hypothetical protein
MSAEMLDEKTRMRAGVVPLFRKKIPEFELYERYTEAQAAWLLKKDVSTFKRARARGDLKHIKDEGRIFYLGYQLVDLHLFGMKPEWDGVERRKAQLPFKKERRVQVREA